MNGFLFDLTDAPQYDNNPSPPPVEARARRSDPQSSKEAAERMNNGRLRPNVERVIDLVYEHPGCTSKELAKFLTAADKADGIDRTEIGRRLPNAEAAGEIHRVKEGTAELKWFPGRAKE